MNQEEYKQLVEEVNYYQDLLEQIEASLNNLRKTKQDLSEFELETANEVLAPIAQGVYVEASLKNRDLFVNIGSDVVVKKSVKEAISIISNQEQDLVKDQNKVIQKLEICYANLQKGD